MTTTIEEAVSGVVSVRSSADTTPAGVSARVRETETRGAHNPETRGSTPRPATNALMCQAPRFAGDPGWSETFYLLGNCRNRAAALVVHHCQEIRTEYEGFRIAFKRRRREPAVQIAAACLSCVEAALHLDAAQSRVLRHPRTSSIFGLPVSVELLAPAGAREVA